MRYRVGNRSRPASGNSAVGYYTIIWLQVKEDEREDIGESKPAGFMPLGVYYVQSWHLSKGCFRVA
jgi:hypothetical protein